MTEQLHPGAEFEKPKEFEPAIKSILDLDFYKLTMAQYASRLYPDVQVKYRFNNRKDYVKLADTIPLAELQQQIDEVMKLRFGDEEINYLASLSNSEGKIFKSDFLESLRDVVLPEPKIEVVDGQFDITVEGDWPVTIFWETYLLSIIDELYYKNLIVERNADLEEIFLEGDRRLTEKIERLKLRPDIKIIEFGTRRRFSEEWQEYVLSRLKNEVPENLVGTSNVYLAQKLGLRPIGTMAHEVFMVRSGINRRAAIEGRLNMTEEEAVRASHNQVLEEWWNMYGEPMSIALSDTYGTEFFLSDMTQEQAEKWRGQRPDSGDPFEEGYKILDDYDRRNIDSLKHGVVFSDGLDIDLIEDLQDEFGGRFGFVTHGWGTNLTNDMGFEPLSIVMKAVEAEGCPLVKLPNNRKKITGATEDVTFYQRVFDNQSDYSKDCVY